GRSGSCRPSRQAAPRVRPPTTRAHGMADSRPERGRRTPTTGPAGRRRYAVGAGTRARQEPRAVGTSPRPASGAGQARTSAGTSAAVSTGSRAGAPPGGGRRLGRGLGVVRAWCDGGARTGAGRRCLARVVLVLAPSGLSRLLVRWTHVPS